MDIVRQKETNIVKMYNITGRYIWGTDRLALINEDGSFNTIYLDTAPQESELITIDDNDLPGDFVNWKYLYIDGVFSLNPLWSE